ncbi:MAG: efflux RND transporter permease subunit [Oscillospiraceae bacterium]|nr:efflux RND transporter permease subunit [Oscillospiraceae bacterium]
MPKFSVKKPFTVFVAVIAILVLGVVAYFKMTPDLLPNMDFPYVMIMTTYPGASPEKVEAEITKPMEQSMSTLEHIKEVTSTSSENYSMVMLEFEESVNLDTTSVDIQQAISSMSAGWDDMVGAPYILKINPSMLPVEVAAVSMDGMDTVELTEFLNETLMNKLEGISGVARISTTGAVVQELHVILDQEKIDALNADIQSAISGELDKAAEELQIQMDQLKEAQEQLANAKNQLATGGDTLAEQTAQGEAQINQQRDQLLTTRADLNDQLIQLQSAKTQLQTILDVLKVLQDGITVLEEEAGNLAVEIERLEELQVTADDLRLVIDMLEAEIQRLEASGSMSLEEIEAAVQRIKNSEEYIQAHGAWTQLQAELAYYGLDADNIQQRLESDRDMLQELSQRLEILLGDLLEQGLDQFSLDDTILEMEGQMAQIDAGTIAIQDGIEQLDAGMLQLEDAQALLSEQKTSGILELANANTELAVNSTTITSALTQLEMGMQTLETSRQEALEASDLNGIITMDMVSGILTAQNFAMPAGYVEQDGISYMVSVGKEITEREALENLLLFDLGMEKVKPIYLKDVAAVMLTDNRDEVYAKLNSQSGIMLSFEKQSTYATAATTNNINDRFRELEAEYPGLQFVALMNQGDYIYLIVDSILSSLLLGAVFAVIVLFLFLKDIRPTFITLCSIPISVVFAIVLMYFSGVTINMISLSGLAVAVGMLVDNSVVVIENIYRLRAKGANVIQAAVSGAQQVAGAVTASTLTTVCVFLPIVFVEGITRQLFTDLALTMTYALMASLIVSLTLVPAMASGMLRKEKQTKETLMNKFLAVYEKLAAWSLDHKAIVLGVSLLLLIVTGVASISRGFIFMPQMDMPNVSVSVTMPEDSSMEDAADLADQVLSRIEAVEGIATIGAMMDSGGSSLLGGGSGTGYSLTVYITLADDTASGAAVGTEIEDACADLPCTVSASSAMLDMSMLTGSGLSMRVYAEDMEVLQSAAREAADLLASLEGVTEASDGLEDAAPALHVDIDRNKAMQKGMTVAQIYMELAAALTNTTTNMTLELDGTSTEVIIERPEGTTLDIDGLKNYRFEVEGRDGEVTTFVLTDVAEVREATSLNAISRISQRRYLSVSATLAPGYNVTRVTSEAERLMARADLGKGVTYEFTGENETIMEAVEQLLLMLLLGVLLVYLVMVAQFQSLKSPFIVMFTIPLAFTGGFIALLLCGMEVSVVSLIGFVMLVGIIVNNGIVLVDYINQLRMEGMERRAAILEAGRTRMRPILMTTITTVLGLIDMAVRKSAGTALMQPIAVVCIGGLIYATLMTLFVVPCIYDLLNKKELRSVREEDLKLLDI